MTNRQQGAPNDLEHVKGGHWIRKVSRNRKMTKSLGKQKRYPQGGTEHPFRCLDFHTFLPLFIYFHHFTWRLKINEGLLQSAISIFVSVPRKEWGWGLQKRLPWLRSFNSHFDRSGWWKWPKTASYHQNSPSINCEDISAWYVKEILWPRDANIGTSERGLIQNCFLFFSFV